MPIPRRFPALLILQRVATVSAGDDDHRQADRRGDGKGQLHDGVITIEESKTAETYSEVVEGMQFDRGYITPYMVTDTEKMEAVIDDAYILITDKKISAIQEILPLLEADRSGWQEAGHHCRGCGRRRSVHPAGQHVCAAPSPV